MKCVVQTQDTSLEAAARLVTGGKSRWSGPMRSGAERRASYGGAGAERGAVLVGLLWCLVLLSVLVIGLLHASRTDLQLARMHADRIQARYLAIAGIERAKALLYQDARERSRSGQSHNGGLFHAPQHFRDVAYGRGTYRVMRAGRPEEGGGVIFGVDDEESRLNLNTVNVSDLGKLEGMTPEIPPAIADWRDGDNQVTAGGAELEYYLALKPPYRPRNGPFLSVRELLLVRSVPRDLLLGDSETDVEVPAEMEEETGVESEAGGSGGQAVERGGVAGMSMPGWASYLTVHSGVANVSATGEERVNLQTADEGALTGVRGITSPIAKAIVAHRGQNRFESLADLLDVRQPQSGGAPGQTAPVGGIPPGGGPARGGGSGAALIDKRLLVEIADAVTVENGSNLEGVVNVNTARLEVLMCLPGMSRELAQAILSYRSSTGFFANTASLLDVPGMTTEIFKSLAARVTARSETFRILAEGRIRSTGVRQRVLAIVRVGLSEVQTLAYRENDL